MLLSPHPYKNFNLKQEEIYLLFRFDLGFPLSSGHQTRKPEFSRTGLKPAWDRDTFLRIFLSQVGSEIKISIRFGSGCFLPEYHIFSREFRKQSGFKWKPCLTFPTWVARCRMLWLHFWSYSQVVAQKRVISGWW